MIIITIGRYPDNDIVVHAPTVSGKHADVTVDDYNNMVYVDHSTNGTYINGQLIQNASRAVTAADIIKFPDGSLLNWRQVQGIISERMAPAPHRPATAPTPTPAPASHYSAPAPVVQRPAATSQQSAPAPVVQRPAAASLQSAPAPAYERQYETSQNNNFQGQFVPSFEEPAWQPEPAAPAYAPVSEPYYEAEEEEYKVKTKHKVMRGFAFGVLVASIVFTLVSSFVYLPVMEYLYWGERIADIIIYVLLFFLAANTTTRISAGILTLYVGLYFIPVGHSLYYVMLEFVRVYAISLILTNNKLDLKARRWIPMLMISVIGSMVSMFMYWLLPYIAYLSGGELWSGGYELFQIFIIVPLTLVANFILIYSSAFNGNYKSAVPGNYNPLNRYFIAIVLASVVAVLANYLILTL